MPELPEVETILRGLTPNICGKKIISVIVDTPVISSPSPSALITMLTGGVIDKLYRVGKYLFWHITNDKTQFWLMIHLRMTGQLMLKDTSWIGDKHTHIQVEFADLTKKVVYRDIRKFGRWVILPNAPTDYLIEKKVAPDALEMLEDNFVSRISKKSGNIKALLLNQSIVAGIGNIYADEILFRSKIHPEAENRSLDITHHQAIFKTMQTVLKDAVFEGGTSFSDYVDSFGNKGSFQLKLMVYQKKDQPCLKCGTKIARIVVAGRGTHFCPHCQHLD